MPRGSISTSRHSRPRSRMDDPHQQHVGLDGLGGDVTVVDVYDIASDIGKECERIIDHYGADAVTALMPRLINALELLETLATKNEWENTALGELRAKIAQLETDKLERAEYREKFDKELEAIEDQWRTESKELIAVVARLQEENRRLARAHALGANGDLTGLDSRLSTPGGEGVDDAIVLDKLRLSLEKQRDELREKDRILHDKSSDLEQLRSQVDRLTGSSRELRRKHKTLQNQVRTLCDERADFLVQLQDQQRDITALRQRLGLAEKENEDLSKLDITYPSNKAVFDLDDPNRPRFTTAELKDILHERNELKSRVNDLEEELEGYRPKPKIDTRSKVDCVALSEAECTRGQPATSELTLRSFIEHPVSVEEDAPVQGPLPYEPDDAPWKKSSESGIRKFFRKIFSESGSGGGSSGFPRRSLSTLSKMALSATNSTADTLPL